MYFNNKIIREKGITNCELKKKVGKGDCTVGVGVDILNLKLMMYTLYLLISNFFAKCTTENLFEDETVFQFFLVIYIYI